VAFRLSAFSHDHEKTGGYAPGLYYVFPVFDEQRRISSMVAQRAVPLGRNAQIAFMPLSVRIEHTIHFNAATHEFGHSHLPLTECTCVCARARVFAFTSIESNVM
jgi:hypothetical protein